MKMKKMTGKLFHAMALTIAMTFAVSAGAAPVVVEEALHTERITLTFSDPMDAGSLDEALCVKVLIPNIGQGTVTGMVNLDDAGTTVTFTPNSELNSELTYIVEIKGAKDASGADMASYEHSFSPGEKPVDHGDLPVILPDSYDSFYYTGMSWDQLNNITVESESGLGIDLGDSRLWGNICVSQYPFEAGESAYDSVLYIDQFGEISEGVGTLPLANFYRTKYDANEWLTGGLSSATPTAEYRLELFDGNEFYGIFISHVSFDMDDDGVIRKMPTITDGPYVTMVLSDDPTSAEIAWETDELCLGEVITDLGTYPCEGEMTKHAVQVTGLSPDTDYDYTVRCVAGDGRETLSNTYTMRTAPEKGEGAVSFAFASDTRSSSMTAGGPPIGDWNQMGSNANIFSELVSGAYDQGADFFLFGGDLIWGMTMKTEDFELQLKGWKQIMAPYWRSRPVYTGLGNHEGLWNVVSVADFIVLDKWPYETESGEAVFAAEFYNPMNGPEPSDSRRPSYKETVYSFQYGPVMVISVNNTYWIGTAPSTYGGSPWGYIMEDQIEWIEDKMVEAENDPTVKTVFAFMHAPVFPNMRHVGGAMFKAGNNNERAYVKNAETGELEPEEMGIIEVRNRMWKAFASSSKMAAVFTGDEHAYHRTLITSETPVGLYPEDDTDGDGVLDKFSPNPDFTHPVWHVTCGGGGAPYVANLESEAVPWAPERVTSHYGYVLVEAEGDKAGLKFIANSVGEVMDEVEDLMAVDGQ